MCTIYKWLFINLFNRFVIIGEFVEICLVMNMYVTMSDVACLSFSGLLEVLCGWRVNQCFFAFTATCIIPLLGFFLKLKPLWTTDHYFCPAHPAISYMLYREKIFLYFKKQILQLMLDTSFYFHQRIRIIRQDRKLPDSRVPKLMAPLIFC